MKIKLWNWSKELGLFKKLNTHLCTKNLVLGNPVNDICFIFLKSYKIWYVPSYPFLYFRSLILTTNKHDNMNSALLGREKKL